MFAKLVIANVLNATVDFSDPLYVGSALPVDNSGLLHPRTIGALLLAAHDLPHRSLAATAPESWTSLDEANAAVERDRALGSDCHESSQRAAIWARPSIGWVQVGWLGHLSAALLAGHG